MDLENVVKRVFVLSYSQGLSFFATLCSLGCMLRIIHKLNMINLTFGVIPISKKFSCIEIFDQQGNMDVTFP